MKASRHPCGIAIRMDNGRQEQDVLECFQQVSSGW